MPEGSIRANSKNVRLSSTLLPSIHQHTQRLAGSLDGTLNIGQFLFRPFQLIHSSIPLQWMPYHGCRFNQRRRTSSPDAIRMRRFVAAKDNLSIAPSCASLDSDSWSRPYAAACTAVSAVHSSDPVCNPKLEAGGSSCGPFDLLQLLPITPAVRMYCTVLIVDMYECPASQRARMDSWLANGNLYT